MRYYLTTAIPYVNAKPHLGFVLEIIQADAYKRFLELEENEVYFVTGTDENSLKNVIAAREKNITPQKLVDQNSQYFQNLKELFNLSNNDFISESFKSKPVFFFTRDFSKVNFFVLNSGE